MWLNLNKFTDTLAFLKKNYASNTYNRYLVGMDSKDHEFLTVSVNPPTLSESTYLNFNFTRDGGETFRVENNHILYGTYFFLG